MSMFDSLVVKCSKCGYCIKFQSKVGDCTMHYYSIEAIPDTILADLNGKSEQCEKCGHIATIKTKTIGYVE